MKKMMCILATAIAALVLTGCGGKPKIPANTVVACYVDLEKCLKNGNDIAELVIDNLPKHLKGKAEDAHEKAREEFEKNLSSFDFKWLAVTVGTDGKGTEEIAAVVRCDYLEKNESGKNLPQLIEDYGGVKRASKFDTDVINVYLPGFGMASIAFVDEDYIILTKNEDWLEKMVRLYADGKGDTSDAFDDLTDLGSDTVARIQTADAKTLVDLAGVRDNLESFGEQCDDADFIEDLLDIGNITLDITVSDDVLGCELTVEAGSKELAKAVEGFFNIVALCNHIGADAVAAISTYGKLLPLAASRELDAFGKLLKEETLYELAAMIRDSVEVDRSGSTVKASCTYDTEDLVELLVPPLAEIADKEL